MPIFTCPDTPETYVVKELKDEIERLTAENAALTGWIRNIAAADALLAAINAKEKRCP